MNETSIASIVNDLQEQVRQLEVRLSNLEIQIEKVINLDRKVFGPLPNTNTIDIFKILKE